MRKRPAVPFPMKSMIAAFSVFVAIAGGLLTFAQSESGEVTAFVGVDVLPMDRQSVLEDYVVLVQGDRIVEVGPTDHVDIPPGAKRIDARGKFLMPGLTEMHGHVPREGGAYSGADVSLLYVANGVTTVRGMLGHESQLRLRRRIQAGEIIGPTYYLSGPAAAGRSPVWGEPKTEADGEAIAKKVAEAGYEAVKIHEGLPRAAYDGLMRAAKTAGLLTGGHVPNDVGLIRAIDAHQGTVEHLDGYLQEMVAEDAQVEIRPGLFQPQLIDHIDEGKMEALAARVRDAGVANVPTLSLYASILGGRDPDEQAAEDEMRYVPPDVLANWKQARRRQLADGPDQATVEKMLSLNRKIVKTLHDAGAAVYLGSDSPQIFQVPGFSLHHELREMLAAGLSPYEALAAGTRASAGFFRKLDKFGRVATGYRADLVLVEGNPVDDISQLEHLAGVMVRGRWYPEEMLQQKLEELAASYRQE